MITDILQKCEKSSSDVTAAHIQVLEQVVSRIPAHITQDTAAVLLHCLRVDFAIGGSESPQMIALNQVCTITLSRCYSI